MLEVLVCLFVVWFVCLFVVSRCDVKLNRLMTPSDPQKFPHLIQKEGEASKLRAGIFVTD